eukprot:TRINITY_DN776118_c0_g1_i1.p1 TRINITY_DN776118_c0_g1~~TRINITY_DN776118_c0_g1_i1.p1  ORF type:complete len:580 (-),score=167.50 TRINITY_DN776118_c0_g1_i1:165-1904(-)
MDENEEILKAEQEEREELFFSILNNVGANQFSKWEKILPLISFEEGLSEIPSRERRRLFDKFVRVCPELQRKERKRLMETAKAEFMTMLNNENVLGIVAAAMGQNLLKVSDEDFLDQRIIAIGALDDLEEFKSLLPASLKGEFREIFDPLSEKDGTSVFEDALAPVRDSVHLETGNAFKKMLGELPVTAGSRWTLIKPRIEKDIRYEMVTSRSRRHNLFDETVKEAAKEKQENKEKRESKLHESRLHADRFEQKQTHQLTSEDEERRRTRMEQAWRQYRDFLAEFTNQAGLTWEKAKIKLERGAGARFNALFDVLSERDLIKRFEDEQSLLESRVRSNLRKLFVEKEKEGVIPEISNYQEFVKIHEKEPRFYAAREFDRETSFERFIDECRDRRFRMMRDFMSSNKLIEVAVTSGDLMQENEETGKMELSQSKLKALGAELDEEGRSDWLGVVFWPRERLRQLEEYVKNFKPSKRRHSSRDDKRSEKDTKKDDDKQDQKEEPSSRKRRTFESNEESDKDSNKNNKTERNNGEQKRDSNRDDRHRDDDRRRSSHRSSRSHRARHRSRSRSRERYHRSNRR